MRRLVGDEALMKKVGGLSVWSRLMIQGKPLLRSAADQGCRCVSSLRQQTTSATTPVEPRAWFALLGKEPFAWWGNEWEKLCRLARGEGGLEVETCGSVCEEAQLDAAFTLLALLVEQESYVPASLFYSILKECMAKRDLVAGTNVHAFTRKSGYESNTFLANHLICMYAAHGRLLDAVQVFAHLVAPDSFMWASIIMAHVEHGQPAKAIHWYGRMRESTLKPDNHIFVAALKACAVAVDLASGRHVHADVLGSAVEPNMFVANGLVDMYAKCGSLEEARRVFESLTTRDIVTWTVMISGYAQHGLGQEALTLYVSMQQGGMNPADRVTLLSLVKACASVGALHEGKQLHALIRKVGLEADLAVGNSLVDMYAKCGSLKDARKVFDGLTARDVVSWTAMIRGYAELGLGEAALALYTTMQEEGLIPADHVTFVCLLKACAGLGALHRGKQVHVQIQEAGLECDVSVGTSLVDMYAKCGSLTDACKVFDSLPTKHVVAWTAMITAYAQHGFGEEALAVSASMEKLGLTPGDVVTYVSLLRACASIGALHQGKQLHSQLEKQGLDNNVIVGSSLVDMYAKCGSLGEARRVFNNLDCRNVITWNALLNGYGQHNECQKALNCFEEMQEHGVEPNHATFVSLLVACSHAGLVDAGKQYFRMMGDVYGITPTADHYNSMVDLLGRAGCLDAAEHMLLSMPFQNDSAGWMSLLTACRSHGDTQRARRCFDHITRLEPQNTAAYVLLSKTFADAGMWGAVERVESMRKSAGACKKPARAWIEVSSKVHTFVVGEERDDLTSKLRSLNQRLREDGGDTPLPGHVVKVESDDQEKEDALCGHAEKLALAYGLLNTPDGSPLLVTKNLRMCNDCHSGTKVLSRIERRDIVVRDAHRVHHFVDGFCKCETRL